MDEQKQVINDEVKIYQFQVKTRIDNEGQVTYVASQILGEGVSKPDLVSCNGVTPYSALSTFLELGGLAI